jgi:hypothetical protein
MKPKFTLRDLLWLMVVVGLALGWWLDHRALREEIFNLHVQTVMNFPGPEPKPEVRIQLLEERNAELEAQLAEFRQYTPPPAPSPPADEEKPEAPAD